MATITTRVLDRPTILGRRTALAVRGDGRFARIANMTGREVLTAFGRSERAQHAVAIGMILGAIVGAVAIMHAQREQPEPCPEVRIVVRGAEIEWIGPAKGYLGTAVRFSGGERKGKIDGVEETPGCVQELLRPYEVEPGTVLLPAALHSQGGLIAGWPLTRTGQKYNLAVGNGPSGFEIAWVVPTRR